MWSRQGRTRRLARVASLLLSHTLSFAREQNNTRQDSSASIPINSHRLPALTADDPRQVFLLFNDFLYCELNIGHQALIRTYDLFRLWLAYVPSITKIGVPISKGRANYPGTMCFLVKIEMNQGPPGRGDQICGAGLGPGSDSAKHPVPVGTSVQGSGQNQRASVELTEFRAPSRQWSATAINPERPLDPTQRLSIQSPKP